MKGLVALCCAAFLCQFFRLNNGAAIINQLSTRRWPFNVIPLRGNFAGSYNTADGTTIIAAATQISIDLGYCVNFTFIQPNILPGQPFINIQPALTTSGAVTSMCFSYYGYNPQAGNNGQALIMFSSSAGNGIGGCLDNLRDAMRYLVNALGQLNEWERSDRNPFMIFNPNVDRNSLVASTLQSKQLFSDTHKLNSSVAQMFQSSYSTDFDLDSITMITGQRYAALSSQPVFTIASGGAVGQSARLSIQDCKTLKNLYGCSDAPGAGLGPTPTCSSLTSSSGGSVTLMPNPAILNRALQCSTTGSPSNLDIPITLGYFWINGGPSPAQGQTDPVVNLVPLINGIAVALVKLNGAPSATGPSQNVAPTNAAGLSASNSGGVTEGCTPNPPNVCVYAVKFTMSILPTKGLLNQQTTVSYVVTSGSTSTTYSLALTMNIDCAPQFVLATALEGNAASVVTQRQLTFGTAANAGISLNPPPTTAVPIQSGVITAANTILAPFVVNYIAQPFGQSGTQPTTANTAPYFLKVFVNCIGSNFAGTTVIGTVSAVDPDGGTVKYYAYSGSPGAAAGGGEKVEVTMDGIITISSYAIPAASPVAPATDGATDSTLAVSPTNPREYFIVAVDSNGGQSVLRLQYFFQCGPTFFP